MDRIQDNEETIKTISEMRKQIQPAGIFERAITELCILTAYAADISRSLAIISDSFIKDQKGRDK